MDRDGLSDFERWFESLPEDDANELANGMDECLCRALTGIRGIEGFEGFLVEYLPAHPKLFLAPLYNVSQVKL